jgi:hypothetical protein
MISEVPDSNLGGMDSRYPLFFYNNFLFNFYFINLFLNYKIKLTDEIFHLPQPWNLQKAFQINFFISSLDKEYL